MDTTSFLPGCKQKSGCLPQPLLTPWVGSGTLLPPGGGESLDSTGPPLTPFQQGDGRVPVYHHVRVEVLVPHVISTDTMGDSSLLSG